MKGAAPRGPMVLVMSWTSPRAAPCPTGLSRENAAIALAMVPRAMYSPPSPAALAGSRKDAGGREKGVTLRGVGGGPGGGGGGAPRVLAGKKPAVDRAPHDERPRRAVPQTAQHERGHQVAVRPPSTLPAPPERDIE